MNPSYEEVEDDTTTWRFETNFLRSNWECIWGRGCLGIGAEPAEHLAQGCCSVGAEMCDPDEARNISALTAMLDPEGFQFHEAASVGGVFSDDTRTNTRVFDGACIFLNRPGFAGGAGCALHLAAARFDEPPTDWKPSVCWQLPIKIDWEPLEGDRERATVRAWSRADWGDDGESMAWCCTEDDGAYVGSSPVVESLGHELTELVGAEVYVELRKRLNTAGGP